MTTGLENAIAGQRRFDWLLACAASCAVATGGWFFYLLFWSDATWVHPEIVGSASYVWLHPGHESIFQMLRKVTTWRAFDPNVSRMRPVNDLVEVIDAIARPSITRWFGVNLAISLSTIGTMIAAPILLYGWITRATSISKPLALMLVLIFISSTGFLSLTIAYLHPAKKLNLVCLCASLYFAEKARQNEEGYNFIWMWCSILAGSLSDETGLANYIVIAALNWETILSSRRRILAFAAMPFVVTFIAVVVLPAIYQSGWSVLADRGADKLHVFSYLLDLEFYAAFLIGLARSTLSTFGISTHTAWTEIAVVAVLLGVPIIQAFRIPRAQFFKDNIVRSTAVLFAVGFYSVLLDWFPFPHEISYLGSFNYYYHSGMVVLVIVWLANVLDALPNRPLLNYAIAAASACAIVANFKTFVDVNELVEIIHYYPSPRNAVLHGIRTGNALRVSDAAGEERKFETALKGLFGRRWNDNGFYATHRMLVGNGSIILTEDAMLGLVYIFQPKPKT